MTRLSDALVARALRFHVEAVQEPGLLLGLGDPYVAPALAAIHDDLAAPWTVASLAAVAGVSRAVFAERFRQRVGISPGGYLLQSPDGAGEHSAARRTLDAQDGRGGGGVWVGGGVLRGVQALHRHDPGAYRGVVEGSRQRKTPL